MELIAAVYGDSESELGSPPPLARSRPSAPTCSLRSFLKKCPMWLRLRVDRKHVEAAAARAPTPDKVALWGTMAPLPTPIRHFCPLDPVPFYEIVSYNEPGNGDNDADLADDFDMDTDCPHDWRTTYTAWADETGIIPSHTAICKDLEELFPELVECGKVYAVQESDSTWHLYTSVDIEARYDGDALCCALLSRGVVADEIEVPVQIAAALNVDAAAQVRSEFPWHVDVPPPEPPSLPKPASSVEFRTGRKLEGVFEGWSETLGDWDVYDYFTPEADSEKDFLITGHLVKVTNLDRKLVLVHILGGSKKGGAGGRMQACYVCLLFDPETSKFQYATVPHVSSTGETADTPLWKEIQAKLLTFNPTTVSGAIQQATRLIAEKDDGKSSKRKRK